MRGGGRRGSGLIGRETREERGRGGVGGGRNEEEGKGVRRARRRKSWQMKGIDGVVWMGWIEEA
eukprot:5955456-Pleurochrysis_carterae.AAC.17